MKKYSVIIPVYKAEKTLRRCVDSLLRYDREDVEVILVNDGSPDKSGDICEWYKNNDKRILYVNKRNGGVSSARNAGLDVAEGKYVLFVDSDDFVTEDYFTTLDQLVAVDDIDLIQFSALIFDGNKFEKLAYSPQVAVTPDEYISSICDAVCRKTINSPWSKIFKRSIIEQGKIRFDERVSIGEDKLFNIKYATLGQSYMVSDKCLYVVSTENVDSLSRNISADYSEQFEILNLEIKSTVNDANISDDFKKSLIRTVNFCNCRGIYHDAKLLHQNGEPWKKRMKILRDKCDEINSVDRDYPDTAYCRLIVFPVKHHICLIIDILAWLLVNGAVKRR